MKEKTMRFGMRVEKFWRDFVEFKLPVRQNICCGEFMRNAYQLGCDVN
jgi:hypothetical protein